MIDNAREKKELSGPWQIAFDPDDVGSKEGWASGHWPEERALPVHVPGIWNIDYPDADGVGFYRTTFTVPSCWQDKAILLHFQGAIYRCDAWLGNTYIGSHEGGYTPFSFDITPFIQAGQEYQLIVRVAALSKKKVVDGMQIQHAPLSKQTWHYVYGGLWGQIYLEACPQVACETLHIDPSLRLEQAQVEISLRNRHDRYRQASVHFKVLDPHNHLVLEQEHVVSALPGLTSHLYTLHLTHPLAWSCDNPNLYRLETRVIDEDGETDEQVIHFGMRDFTVQNGTFFLNGEPVYIRGVLLQPNFPINLINYPNSEMMVREMNLVKQAGFNLLRLHIQPAPDGLLDLADRLGILIYSETSLAWIRDNPRMLDHGRRETKTLIDQDRNHPSVVIWGIYNENPPACATNGEVLIHYARAIDPTRVVVDNSGGSLAIDQDFGWIDRASVIPAYQNQAERILDIHLYLGAPISASLYDWLRNLGKGGPSRVIVEEKLGSTAVFDEFDRETRAYPGQVFVSELGHGGMSDLDDTIAGFGGREELLDARELITLRDGLHEGFQKRKLERVFGSPRNLFLEAQKLQVLGNTRQIEALLTNPRVSGYIITQLNDVSWEFHAGLLDLWRNPKPAYYAAQRLNQPHIIVLRLRKTTAKPGDRVEIEMHLVSADKATLPGQLCLTVIDPANNTVLTHQEEILLRPGIQPLPSAQFPVETPGTYRILAQLRANDQTLFETTESVLSLDAVDWGDLQVDIRPVGQKPSSALFQAIDQRNTNSVSPVSLVAQPSTLDEPAWESLLASVEAGETAILGALKPEDQAAIAVFARHGIQIQLHFGIGSWMGCYHWIPESALFSGLPSGCLAMAPYTDTLPKYVLTELGGEVQAGSLRNTQSRIEVPSMLWYSDIEVLRLGKGKLLFCQYRVFEALDRDPVADRLAWNVLHFASKLAEGDRDKLP
jgi:hypothetical protein